MSSVFFNGRLWISPSVMSAINDSAMISPSLTVGNISCFVGQCTAGEPNVALPIGSPAEAASILGSGDLVTAVQKAFTPSNQTGGPATVLAVRVNPALQSSLTVMDGTGAAAIDVLSSGYGATTVLTSVAINEGSEQGQQLVVTANGASIVVDNILDQVASVQYTGSAQTATMSITGTTVTLSAPTGTIVATIPLATYSTVQQLVDYINTVSHFSAAVLGGFGDLTALNGLDFVTAQNVLVAFDVTANNQAMVNAMNTQVGGVLSATRAPTATQAPAVMAPTYLAGGSDGVVTNTQWSDALTMLQTVDLQWLSCVSGSPSIHAMADAHVQFMSTVGMMERRAISGPVLGTTDAAAEAEALSLNSDRTLLVHLGYWDYNAAGQLVLLPPYQTAALIAGMFSGVSPGTPLTNKTINVAGLERLLQYPTDTDPLLQAGVCPVYQAKTGFKIAQSISTWLATTAFDKTEMSCGAALDYTVRAVREAINVLVGQGGSPAILSQAISITDTTLRLCATPAPNGPGTIVGDANSPPYLGITAALVDDVLSVSFQCSPVIPVNYVPITVYAVPYSGTATASSSGSTVTT